MYSKTLEDRFLKVVLACGWASGNFPATEPLQITRKHRFWSLITFISLGHLILQVILGIIYLTTSSELIKSMKFSQFLLTYLMLLLVYNFEMARKTLSVVHCSDIIYLLKVCSTYDRNHSNLLILILTLVSSCFFLFRRMTHFISYYSVDYHLTYVTTGISIIDTIYLVCGIYSDLISMFSTYFSFCIIMILGNQILCVFEKQCCRFKENIITKERMWIYDTCYAKNLKNMSMKNQEALKVAIAFPKQSSYTLLEFNKIFSEFKIILQVFNKVAGRIAFTFILQFSFMFINCIYGIFWPLLTSGRVTNVFGIATSLMILFSLTHLGTVMEVKVIYIYFHEVC